MVRLIFEILLIATIGSLTVPAMLLALAKLSYFEPIEFELFGTLWRFAPQRAKSTLSATNTSMSSYAANRPTFSAGAILVLVQLPLGAAIAVSPNFNQTVTGTPNSGTLIGRTQ